MEAVALMRGSMLLLRSVRAVLWMCMARQLAGQDKKFGGVR